MRIDLRPATLLVILLIPAAAGATMPPPLPDDPVPVVCPATPSSGGPVKGPTSCALVIPLS